MEYGKLTGVVFLDLKKAFDTVDHSIVSNKLRTFNIDNHTILWYKNYLQDRTQCVCYKGKKSDKLPLRTGVPQGSILGPLLFISYINDLSDYIEDCHTSLYADGTALFTTSESHIELMLN